MSSYIFVPFSFVPGTGRMSPLISPGLNSVPPKSIPTQNLKSNLIRKGVVSFNNQLDTAWNPRGENLYGGTLLIRSLM